MNEQSTEPAPEIYSIPHGPEDERVEIAKSQEEYRTLHAINLDMRTHLHTIVCWRLTWRARLRLLFTGKLWHTVMRDGPLQPMLLTTRRSDHYSMPEEQTQSD